MTASSAATPITPPSLTRGSITREGELRGDQVFERAADTLEQGDCLRSGAAKLTGGQIREFTADVGGADNSPLDGSNDFAGFVERA